MRTLIVQAITLSRSGAAIGFATVAFIPELRLLAIGLFLYAFLADALDGALARRWGATSQAGAVFDGFADKYLSMVSVLYLAALQFNLLSCALLVFRDLFVACMRGVHVSGSQLIVLDRRLGVMSGLPIKILVAVMLIYPETASLSRERIQQLVWLLSAHSFALLGISLWRSRSNLTKLLTNLPYGK